MKNLQRFLIYLSVSSFIFFLEVFVFDNTITARKNFDMIMVITVVNLIFNILLLLIPFIIAVSYLKYLDKPSAHCVLVSICFSMILIVLYHLIAPHNYDDDGSPDPIFLRFLVFGILVIPSVTIGLFVQAYLYNRYAKK